MSFRAGGVWFLFLGVILSAEEPSTPKPIPANSPEAAKPAEAAVQPQAQRTRLNLLGQTDAASGESRRNENVQFNLIDTSTVKELNVRLGTSATIVPEFQPQSSYFGAEYGNKPAPSVHLPPAPSPSAIHGMLYESHLNSVFSARSFFQATSVRPARENDYGFNVSTPLWRRARWSLDASQQKLRGNVNGNVLVPKPDERTPLTNDPRLRPIVTRFLSAYPDEAPNRTDIDPRALNTNALQRINTNMIGARLDQDLDARNRLAFRYLFTLQQVDPFQFVAGQNPDTDTRSHTARISFFRAVSPSTLVEMTAGFDRLGSHIRPEENAIGPSANFGRMIEGLGPAPPLPIDRAENSYRYAAQVSHTRGEHQLGAGFEIIRRQINGLEQDGTRGILTFANDFGRDALTNLRMGTPNNFVQAFGNHHRGFRQWLPAFYASDQWKATSSLSLSLGIRYEPVPTPVEVNRIDVTPFPCDCNNFAPRFGVARRLPGNWGIVRAAYGLQYGQIFETTYSQTRLNPPGSFRLVVGTPDLADPLAGIDLGNVASARSGRFLVSPELVSPYSHQYNASWEPSLGQRWKLQIGYVGSRSLKLFQMWFENRAHAVPGIPQTSATINQRRPDPDVLEVFRLVNASRSYFDAARVSATMTSWRGFTIDTSYWFSKAIDIGNDYTSTLSGSDARTGRSQGEANVHQDLKGLSSFDQPHALLTRVGWELPHHWHRAARDWSFSGVLLLKTGTPFSVESGSDGPGFGNVDGQGSDRVNLIDPAVLGQVVGDPDTSTQLLPRSAFAFISPTDERGSLGRNTFRRGKIANVNAAAARTWAIHREMRLTLRAESINLFNTPQFAEPSINLASPSFGQITNTLNDGRTFRFLLRLQF